MTRCNRSDVNLKSTAYNQNGQNYFEQLTAYNSMRSHLRRVLLAKCVVDAKNKNCTRRRKQLCKDVDYKAECGKTEIENDVIDRLAYDTLHHPADFLRMSYNRKYLCQREGEKYFTDYCNYDVICSRSRLRNRVICPDSPMSKVNRFELFIPSGRNIKRRYFSQINHNNRFKPVDVKSAIKIQDISEHRFGDNSIVYESASDFITQEVNRFSSIGRSSRSDESYENAQEFANMDSIQKRHSKEEEVKYTKFVYEITREIISRGLYTDKELQEVFKKHFEQNKTVLDKNKMLYEIYQLKVALNVSEDDGSDEEELEDFIHTQQLLNTSTLRPPTPPKTLNDDKLFDKLRSYEETDKFEQESNTNRRKSVVLIDANPELVVTERDILTSLIAADVNPVQAQKICKQLLFKSKDALPLHQTEASRSNDERIVCECDPSNPDLNQSCKVQKEDGQEKSCTTYDLIEQNNKNI